MIYRIPNSIDIDMIYRIPNSIDIDMIYRIPNSIDIDISIKRHICSHTNHTDMSL